MALTDSSGAIAQSYRYSPYGRVISASGNAPSLFGFAGGLNIPGGGGLIHFGARLYNPSAGSWTQLDPSGQSSGYVYAGDNPVNFVDGSGLGWIADMIGGTAGFIAAGVGFYLSRGNQYITAGAAACVGTGVTELVSGSTLVTAIRGCSGALLVSGATVRYFG